MLTVDDNITEEETETLIANNTTNLFVGNVKNNLLDFFLFQIYIYFFFAIQKILEDTKVARQNLRDLLVRHSELTKIEKSLTEVRDMFIRISTLVMEQVIKQNKKKHLNL